MSNIQVISDPEDYDTFNEIEIDFEKIIDTAVCSTTQHPYRSLRITFDDFIKVCSHKGSFTLLSVFGSGYNKWYWYHSLNRGLLFVIKGPKGWSYYAGMPKKNEVTNFNKINVVKAYLKRDEILSMKICNFIEFQLLHAFDKLNSNFVLDDYLIYNLNIAINLLDNKKFYELISLEQLISLGIPI